MFWNKPVHCTTTGGSYSTDDGSATTAFAHHITSTEPDATTGQGSGTSSSAILLDCVMRLTHAHGQAGAHGDLIVRASQRLVDELVAELNQAVPESMARQGEVMQRIEV